MIVRKKDIDDVRQRLDELEASYRRILVQLAKLEQSIEQLKERPEPDLRRKPKADLDPIDRPRYVDI